MRPTETEHVGDTARRPAHDRSAFVAAVLAHLRSVGFDAAPLPLGTDERGRQVLEWIPGEVPEGSPFRLTPAQQRAGAVLVRRFHDAAATFPGLAGAETVRHGDLGPHNTVFRDGVPVALIDWDDGVAPGSRADDFAHAVWGYADLLEEQVGLAAQRDGLHLMCATYGGIPPVVVLDELRARFLRAVADHAAHGRAAAVPIFEDLLRRLERDRPALLEPR